MEHIPEFSEQARSIEPGIYRHFKGGLYQVFGVEHDPETGVEEVVYASLNSDGEHRREVGEFLGHVDRPDFEYEGPRFTYVRPAGK